MKIIIIFSVILFFSFAVQSQEKDNKLTPEEFANRWQLLFNGENLNGWKAYNGDIPKSWKVDENSIYCDGTKDGDDIMTAEKFSDFDLKFEWKIPKNGNSGVIYRVREGKHWRKPWMTGAEYQVFGEIENFNSNSVGSLYDVFAPSKNKKVNPEMHWNSGRIRLSRGFITHWVNDVIVMQCQLFSDEWDENIARSKFKDNQYFMKSPFGHIDFQNHGSKVWYKNVKILKL